MGQLSSKLRSIETNRGSGVSFWCPGCQEMHAISVKPLGGAGWEWDGNADAPTFAPSILVTYDGADGSTRCHSFVRTGQIEFLTDCTHALAGRSVPLPDLPSELATTEPA